VVCQFCQRDNSKTKPSWAEWPAWVIVPYLRDPPKLVCSGCAYEIYDACGNEDFEHDVDRELVEEIAASQGMSVRVFRLACLRHQVSVMEKRGCTNREQRAWLAQIQRLIISLHAASA
jgi:hypothetical protein